ncbi:MAG: DM13 domain-containing protein [Candidatus Brennerbacteria bacterium]|nr:DM13 domain-containing protein [Candidatus Brennerbacteria bacterium]
MLKKALISLGIAVAIGTAYWLIAPLFIDVQVSESLGDIYREMDGRGLEGADQRGSEQAQAPALEVIRRGTFVSLAGHSAEGTATLVKIGEKHYVRFENDFRMTNGPDLFVHFGKNDAYAVEARLGALKGNVGGQNYEVPEGIDPTQYDEVWVWCRAFAVPFGMATLN